MNLSDFINVVAIVATPIVAVLVGQKLQEKAKLREDKMQIFKALMTARVYGWTVESVHSLNVIDIVFADDKKVRAAWKELFNRYAIQNPTELDRDTTAKAEYKLIETIGISLGYKDKITWETIQSPYIPKGLINQMSKNNQTQDNFSEAIAMFLSMILQQQKMAEESLNKETNDEEI